MADNGYSSVGGSGLPWSRDLGEGRRFSAIVLVMLTLFLPPAFLIPMLEVPEIERSEAEKVPPRLARLVEKPKPVVPPEPAQPDPEPEPESEPEVTKEKPKQPEPKVAEVEPDPAPAPKPEAEPQVLPKPKQTTEQAREKASRSGLLAMRDKLASLRSPETTPARKFAVNTQADATEVTQSPEDSQQVLSGSGGVEDAPAPETTVALAEHQVKAVDAPAEEFREVAAKPAEAAPSVGERTMSNIRKVFDAQKTALYSMYRRELRQDPTLEGKVLLELVIEPDGSVSACQVVSSELEHPTLEQRIAMRVRLFNFGADNVEARRVRFPIDFLPG
ncbi:AgmX/PglI C-terminal domain-containing protein [Marinobacter sp. BW6]|uniref:AgmX/PglI C-terminal domain-containing protein n=1 Tax=Marinobacter sp. BW6 TaxID=2592624 RepID=UPI0011DEB47E|nr:AgmX/PglI C-terminal domain-containing protein [Marinobacter sp. BW6]TYC62683.1 AgmX/PglI C-terminal domain-containing protein [Marinobacter sp. BW6]